MSAFEVEGVSAIMIYAEDPERLAQWYEEQLGVVTRLDPSDGNYYGDVGDVHFGIYPAEEPLPRPRAVMVNYRVRDLSAALRGLRESGVAIERTVDESYGRFAYLRDPEGNPVELYAPAEPPAEPRS